MADRALRRRALGDSNAQRIGHPGDSFVSVESRARISFQLPLNDAIPGALKAFQHANTHFRTVPWPAPFDKTLHRLRLGDARNLSWIPDASVHLVVTSPPYWNLKEYKEENAAQLEDIANYERFLSELDKVWSECYRVIVPGGRICCVVGDICVPRKREGRHYVMPLHADIQVRSRSLGFDCLTPNLVAQNREWRYGSRGQRRRFLWKAVSAGSYRQERH